MKYAILIDFNPIDSVIQLTSANDKNIATNLVKSYVMSDDMADKLKNNMLSQLRLRDVVDNKGVLLVCEHTSSEVKLPISDYARRLYAQWVSGVITGKEMKDTLISTHRRCREYNV